MLSPTWRLVALSLFLSFLAAAPALGQGLGTIAGTVTDSTGAVIPSAKVKIVDEATTATRETTTNEQGYYVFPALRPSMYTLTVEAQGFTSASRKGITLQADGNVTVNQTVSVQQTQQSIDVNAEASQVNTMTATSSAVVDQRRVVDLPLNGRNAASLLLVVAGAIPSPANDVDQGNTKTFPTVVTVSTNGARQNQVGFRLDGANNNDIYTNVNQPFPFPDALQEFSVQTSNYSARYGGNAGGVVNVVTRSGSNEFHGGVFEFVRNAEFNARNFFAPKRDQLKRNQYGGTFGGPVKIPGLYDGTNHTFFFFGYQGTKIRNITSTSNAYVPTTANLAGDFSALLDASNPANQFGKVVVITDPATGQPFLNNQIPTARFDPAAVAFTKYLPIASTGNGLIFYSVPLAQDFNEYLGRLDHSFSEKDRLSFRYFFDEFQNKAFLDPRNYLSNSNFSTIDSYNMMLGETHVFGASALNEFRAVFSRETSNRGPAPGSIALSDLGVKLYQPAVKTISGINVSGYFNPSQTDPAAFIRNQYNLSDDVSLVRGKHSLSFGVSALRGQVLLRNQFRTSGSYSFTADVTNNALASYLLGYVRTFTQGFGEFKDNLMDSYSLYAQDDYHVSRRLTLNLGLRYDPFFPWQERKGRVEQFVPQDYINNVRSTQFINAPPGLLFPGDPGVPQWGVDARLTNFSPRLGFAYDLTGDGRTSVRGGVGTFYDSLQNGVFNNRFVDVTPFSPQFSLTQPQGPFSNPYLGLVNPYPSPFPPPKDTAFPGPVLVITYDTSQDKKIVTPVIYNWNLMFERQITSDWLVRAAYVGSRTNHLVESLELNPAVYTAGSKLGTDARRLYQPYGSITQGAFDIDSTFHSLQLTAQKRFSHGLTILANYTWSKSLDDMPYNQGISGIAQGSNSPVSWFMPGRHQFDYGPSEFDHVHRFVTSYVYDLPRLAGRDLFVRTVLGGWQWTGIITLQSGGPLTILAGKDQAQTGLGTDRAVFLGGDPYGSSGCGSSGSCVGFLNAAAFGQPALGSWGNVGKGALRGPGLINWDTGIYKEFALYRERLRLQLRGEFFNVTNRVNFNNPNVTQSSGGFGAITGAADPRIGQLALKLLF
jgi:hypothetical protein